MLSFGRLCCMAAMAPALTDATAHPSSFKLPASPANPGQAPQTGGVQPFSQDPRSPGLPNGRTNIHCQTAQLQAIKDTTALVRTATVDSHVNNNHLVKARLSNSITSSSTTSRQRNHITTNNHQPSVLQTNGHPKTKRVGQSAAPRKELPALRLINGNGVSLVTQSKTLNMNHHPTIGRPSVSGSTTEQHLCNLKVMPPQSSSAPHSPAISGSASTGDLQPGSGSDSHSSSSSSMPASPRSILSSNQSKMDLPGHGPSSSSCDTNGNNASDTMSIEFTEEQSESMAKQQMRLEQRARWLASRLRRLQSQEAKNHVQKQLGGIVGFHRTKWEVLRKQNIKTQSQETCQQCKQRQDGLPDSKGRVPACTLCNNFPSENPTSVFQRLTRTDDRVLAQRILRGEDRDVFRDVKTVSRKLNATLGHVENGIDSDATDESSGGESCDEGDDAVSYDNRMPQRVPLHKRAIWKWALDRASIASRWTWLQAQVSDLEYRIRQQSDIYRQIRATKGTVTLGEPLSPAEMLCMRTLLATSRTNRKLTPIEAKIARLEGRGREHVSPSNLSSLLTNVDRQSARLKRSLQNCISPISQVPLTTGGGTKLHAPKPMNGLVDGTAASGSCVGGNQLLPSKPSTSTTTPDGDNKRVRTDATTTAQPTPPEENYCARTRPVKYYRKRKLIRTLSIHQTSRKAQKPSTVHCGCNRPSNPCVMCGGRFNHVKKMDMEVMSYNERVAHVDFSYHPVLSLPQDIPLSVHYEALLKSGEWQRKPKTRTPKKFRLFSQSRLGNERRKDRAHEKGRGRSLNKGLNRTPSRDRRDRVRQKDKSRKLLQKMAAHKFRELSHARGDSKMSRSFSSPNSLPSTPKDRSSMDCELSLRQVQSEMKKRRQALGMAAMKSRERSNSMPNIERHDINLEHSAPSTPTFSTPDSKPLVPPLSHSLPGKSLQSLMRQHRRMGGSDAYDIDNIVIPYSMLASTRVERLTYKEIMTPKWRQISYDNNASLGVGEEQGSDEEEDMSEIEFQERHFKCEITERQKYMALLAEQAWSNSRRGSRRSRNNSVVDTPEPRSPDTALQEAMLSSSFGDESAATSPVPDEKPTITRSSERRRASSAASETHSEPADDYPSHTVIHPWFKRAFPLTESDTEDLGEECEEDTVHIQPEAPADVIPASQQDVPLSVKKVSGTSTPDMDSSDCEPPQEDPNDPEWTVITLDKPKKLESTTKTTLVLKLAKR